MNVDSFYNLYLSFFLFDETLRNKSYILSVEGGINHYSTEHCTNNLNSID